MPDELKRREFLVTAAAAGAAATTAGAGTAEGAAPDSCPAGPRCPYFDQPLFCEGKKYCEK